MIVSNDLKSIYIAAPKSGSRTAEFLLKDYGTFVGDHLTATQTLSAAQREIEGFDYKTVENFFVFWRDPIDKFLSAVNFLRSKRPSHVLLKNPEWFTQFDYSQYIKTTNTGLKIFDIAGLSPELKAAVEAITPEQLLDAHIEAKRTGVGESYMVLDKQSHWIQPGLNVLDYANFDTNMRTVMDAFGVPANKEIPVMNTSDKLTTTLTTELEIKVREYYAEDFELKPT